MNRSPELRPDTDNHTYYSPELRLDLMRLMSRQDVVCVGGYRACLTLMRLMSRQDVGDSSHNPDVGLGPMHRLTVTNYIV